MSDTPERPLFKTPEWMVPYLKCMQNLQGPSTPENLEYWLNDHNSSVFINAARALIITSLDAQVTFLARLQHAGLLKVSGEEVRAPELPPFCPNGCPAEYPPNPIRRLHPSTTHGDGGAVEENWACSGPCAGYWKPGELIAPGTGSYLGDPPKKTEQD
jgi:hypothetical protein